jgi:hypothetical protein
MVGDLMVQRLAYAVHERIAPIDPHKRAAEEGDLAGDGQYRGCERQGG